jgi:hypothetical protein
MRHILMNAIRIKWEKSMPEIDYTLEKMVFIAVIVVSFHSVFVVTLGSH